MLPVTIATATVLVLGAGAGPGTVLVVYEAPHITAAASDGDAGKGDGGAKKGQEKKQDEKKQDEKDGANGKDGKDGKDGGVSGEVDPTTPTPPVPPICPPADPSLTVGNGGAGPSATAGQSWTTARADAGASAATTAPPETSASATVVTPAPLPPGGCVTSTAPAVPAAPPAAGPGLPTAPPVDASPTTGLPGAPGAPASPTAPTAPGAPALPGGSPAGGAPAPAPAVSVGAQEYFVGDFDNGFADWATCQSPAVNGDCSKLSPGQHNMQIIKNGAPDGGAFARFVVKDGDTVDFGGERSEVRDDNAGATVHEGDERWYEWSMRVNEDFPKEAGGWFIVMQWHSSHGSPPLAVDLSKGTVDIGGDGVHAPRKAIGPIPRGEWAHYILHVKFSNSADKGFVEAWENGAKTVELTKRQTMTSNENYLKQGIYRDESASGTAQVDFDGLRVTGPPGQGEVQPKLLDKVLPKSVSALLGIAGAVSGLLEPRS